MQDVVLVCRNHQTVNRQAHALGKVACKDIPEVSGRHGKADLAMRCTQADGSREVVHDLRQHPGEIDRVHPGEFHAIAEIEVVEHVFQGGLTIVEITINRQCVYVAVGGRRHLAALHLGYAAVGVQDEHIHSVQAPERLNRGRAGVTAGCADDGHAIPAPLQGHLKQLTDQLHGKILEG